MTIANVDGYIAATKQVVPWYRGVGRTSLAGSTFTAFDLQGVNGSGTLAGASTAAGVVPVAGNLGYPSINAFAGGATGYLSRLEYNNTQGSRLVLYDRLFLAGAYAFNANVALAGQPSYAGRVPGGDYSGLEIWLEQVTAGTGIQNVTVTYTNEAGVAGRTTGLIATAANIVGRCFKLPLQAGDSGVQKIESVVGSVATAGTFNIMVLRNLAWARCTTSNAGDHLDPLRTGMPQVFATSALYPLIGTDGTSTGAPDLRMEIASG